MGGDPGLLEPVPVENTDEDGAAGLLPLRRCLSWTSKLPRRQGFPGYGVVVPKEPAKATEDADDADQESAFERFEALTRKLVSVPKSEIDKLRNGNGQKKS